MPLRSLDSLDPLCPSCGYNLRALTSTRCPECGQPFDPEKISTANIPWLKRAALGIWPAYWQTVHLAIFHPRKFADEIWNAPRLDLKSATHFRRITIRQTLITSLLLMSLLILIYIEPWHNMARVFTFLLPFAAFVFVFIHLATDVSQFLSPGQTSTGDQFWRKALASYATAPLALTPFLALSILIADCTHLPDLWLLPLIIAFAIWWIVTILMMHSIHDSIPFSIWLAILLPLTWIVSAIAAFLISIFVVSITILISRAFF